MSLARRLEGLGCCQEDKSGFGPLVLFRQFLRDSVGSFFL